MLHKNKIKVSLSLLMLLSFTGLSLTTEAAGLFGAVSGGEHSSSTTSSVIKLQPIETSSNVNSSTVKTTSTTVQVSNSQKLADNTDKTLQNFINATKAEETVPDTVTTRKMKSAIEELEAAQADIRNNLAKVKANYADMDTKYSIIKSERKDLIKQINQTKKDLKGPDSKYAEVDRNYNLIKSNRRELKKQLNSLEKQMKNIDNLKTKINSNMTPKESTFSLPL